MMDKKQATEIVIPAGTDLDVAVEFLIAARKIYQNFYVIFNGHKLYSADVTMDSAYLEVTRKTKAMYDAELNRLLGKDDFEKEEK